MKFSIVKQNGEDLLYAYILSRQHGGDAVKDVQFLYCQFFHIGHKPDPEQLQEILQGILFNQECTVYICSDGDVYIRWPGQVGLIGQRLVEAISNEYGEVIDPVMQRGEFFQSYTLFDAEDIIKAECLKKQKKPSKQTQKLQEYFTNTSLLSSLKKVIHLVSTQRVFRTAPHILIVEDQLFSQKMLLAILKDYTCHVAASCGEALLLYMEKCPDIVLLDIDLPDLSGHSFSRLLAKIDEHSFVVMVSANNYQNDINVAKENKVKGFISKPYSKDAILDVIKKFKKNSKKRFA